MPTTAVKNITDTNISAIYDRVYDIADRLFKKHNPCKIHIKDKRIFCNYHNKGIPLSNKYYLCCSSCRYSSKKGCTVRCLSCKLHICGHILYTYDKHGREIRRRKYRGFANRIRKLREIATKHGIYTYTYFHTKDEVLDISKRRIKAG